VERRLECDLAKRAAFEPLRRERAHLVDHAPRFDVGRAE
jgi:hypothetical protein